jgi:hypothetical protein
MCQPPLADPLVYAAEHHLTPHLLLYLEAARACFKLVATERLHVLRDGPGGPEVLCVELTVKGPSRAVYASERRFAARVLGSIPAEARWRLRLCYRVVPESAAAAPSRAPR